MFRVFRGSPRVVLSYAVISISFGCGGMETDQEIDAISAEASSKTIGGFTVVKPATTLFEVVVGMNGYRQIRQSVYTGPLAKAASFRGALVQKLRGPRASKSSRSFFMVRSQDGATTMGPLAISLGSAPSAIATIAQRHGFSSVAAFRLQQGAASGRPEFVIAGPTCKCSLQYTDDSCGTSGTWRTAPCMVRVCEEIVPGGCGGSGGPGGGGGGGGSDTCKDACYNDWGPCFDHWYTDWNPACVCCKGAFCGSVTDAVACGG